MERGGEKMAEKSMSSLPLIKTLKSQIAAQKPLTKKKKMLKLQKRILYIKRQRTSHKKMAGGTIVIKTNFIYT